MNIFNIPQIQQFTVGEVNMQPIPQQMSLPNILIPQYDFSKFNNQKLDNKCDLEEENKNKSSKRQKLSKSTPETNSHSY